MSSDLIQTVREALAKATPGPWRLERNDTEVHGPKLGDANPVADMATNLHNDTEHRADAHLIANAPQWLADLVARVEAAEKEVERLTAWIEAIRDFSGEPWSHCMAVDALLGHQRQPAGQAGEGE